MRRIAAVLVAAACVVASTVASAAATVSASADPAPTPNVANGALESVDCPTSAFCMAVGTGDLPGGGQRALAEQPSDGTWTRVAVPTPDDASDTAFHGVDCLSASFCVAVGDYYQVDRHALIETWNGRAWHLAASPDAGSGADRLRAVSCATETSCYAVGETDRDDGTATTLIEFWDGTSWHVVGSPSPGRYARLRGVACPTATVCFAVGTAGGSETAGDGTSGVVERLTPQGWVADAGTATPALTAPVTPGLYGISCTSTSFCLAVGWNATFTGGPYPTVERWDGTEWTGANSTWNRDYAELSAVSCTSPTSCTLLARDGRYTARAGTWDGTTATDTTTVTGVLTGISCTSSTACVAVGTTGTTIVQAYDGAQWTRQQSTDVSGDPGSELTAVSCTFVRRSIWCLALGDQVTSTGGRRTFADLQVPRGTRGVAAPRVTDDGYVEWTGLSCPSSTFCAAGGESSGAATMLQTWDGTRWHPANRTPAGGGVRDVSCTSATFCLAVDANGAVVRWDGTTWTLVAHLQRQSLLTVQGLDCVAPDDCTVVGTHYVRSSGSRPTIQHWDGTAWALVRSPAGPQGYGSNELHDVSCVSATYCVAVGSSTVGSAYPTSSLVDTWDGTTWKATPHPAQPADLLSVSCGAVGACVAGSDDFRTLYASSGVWGVEPVYGPSTIVSPRTTTVSDVDCPDAYSCVGVGSYSRAAGPMALQAFLSAQQS